MVVHKRFNAVILVDSPKMRAIMNRIRYLSLKYRPRILNRSLSKAPEVSSCKADLVRMIVVKGSGPPLQLNRNRHELEASS